MKNVIQRLCPGQQFNEILNHVTQSRFTKPKNVCARVISTRPVAVAFNLYRVETAHLFCYAVTPWKLHDVTKSKPYIFQTGVPPKL